MIDFLKLEELKNWKRLGCLLAVIGAVQFMVLSSVAMIFYPGGYSIMDNYLSHLGQIEVAGESNTISYVLWVVATVVAGLILIPFWIVLRTLFTKTRGNRISLIGTSLGVVSGPFLIGIGIFSMSTHASAHGLATIVFFLLFAAAIAVYSVAILFNEEYPNMYSFVGVVFSILIVLFVGGAFAAIDVLMQKIIVYGFVVWVLFQVTKVWPAVGTE